MPSLYDQLREIAQEVKLLELMIRDQGERDHESVYKYYYGKGALDYRDKLVDLIGSLPPKSTALEIYTVLRETFPDPYPGPAK